MLTWNTLDDTLNGLDNQVKAYSSADVKSFYILEYFFLCDFTTSISDELLFLLHMDVDPWVGSVHPWIYAHI